MGDKRSPRRVKSDETLLSILSEIKDHESTGITAISKELGVAKSTVHSHLSTLHDGGFVTRDGHQYRLGLRFLEYGTFARNQRILFEASQLKVDELAAETGERAWCVCEEGGQGVYLYGSTGKHSIQTDEDSGTHEHLHCIAAGKAILAELPRKRVEEIIAERGLEPHTEYTITDRDELFAELERIRDRGVAYNREESMRGLTAVAVPVTDIDGGVYGSVSIGGPAKRLTESRLKSELTDYLLGAVNEIEINIRHL